MAAPSPTSILVISGSGMEFLLPGTGKKRKAGQQGPAIISSNQHLTGQSIFS
jgi:hypothetical protein